MGIDTRDRVKIRERTRRYPGSAYTYRLHFVNESAGDAFSFLALGDAGSGGRKHRNKFRVADEMAREADIDLILHLGDVVYSSGSVEGYADRFIRPYHHWLKNGDDHRYDDMVFTKPFLPVYGNHDYYDLTKAIPIPVLGGIIGAVAAEVSDEVGSGSMNGKVFEHAFVETGPVHLHNGHLDYVTGERTRLPNRYYWFIHGPCAFFALDSNTLDGVPEPSVEQRRKLESQRDEAEKRADLRRWQLRRIRRHIENKGGPEGIADPDRVEDVLFEIVLDLAEAEKTIAMLEKYLDARREDYDVEQLTWLTKVLQHEDAQGKWKVVYLHHPLYSSDGSHTDDPESDGLRENLRRILVENGVHLVLSGHSHCFEWVMRARPEGGHADPLADAERRICYLVSGGGGRYLRESILEEDASNDRVLKKQRQFLHIAESRAYTDALYHYLRVDVSEERLRVTPVGVLARGDGGTLRESPMRTKVFTEVENRIAVDESRRLACIDVFRDRPPEAEWVPAGSS